MCGSWFVIALPCTVVASTVTYSVAIIAIGLLVFWWLGGFDSIYLSFLILFGLDYCFLLTYYVVSISLYHTSAVVIVCT